MFEDFISRILGTEPGLIVRKVLHLMSSKTVVHPINLSLRSTGKILNHSGIDTEILS